jgi:hypothetical protein
VRDRRFFFSDTPLVNILEYRHGVKNDNHHRSEEAS